MGVFDLDDDEGAPDPDAVVTCKRCGKANLQWYDAGTRWMLIEQTAKLKIHECKRDDAFGDET